MCCAGCFSEVVSSRTNTWTRELIWCMFITPHWPRAGNTTWSVREARQPYFPPFDQNFPPLFPPSHDGYLLVLFDPAVPSGTRSVPATLPANSECCLLAVHTITDPLCTAVLQGPHSPGPAGSCSADVTGQNVVIFQHFWISHKHSPHNTQTKPHFFLPYFHYSLPLCKWPIISILVLTVFLDRGKINLLLNTEDIASINKENTKVKKNFHYFNTQKYIFFLLVL